MEFPKIQKSHGSENFSSKPEQTPKSTSETEKKIKKLKTSFTKEPPLSKKIHVKSEELKGKGKKILEGKFEVRIPTKEPEVIEDEGLMKVKSAFLDLINSLNKEYKISNKNDFKNTLKEKKIIESKISELNEFIKNGGENEALYSRELNPLMEILTILLNKIDVVLNFKFENFREEFRKIKKFYNEHEDLIRNYIQSPTEVVKISKKEAKNLGLSDITHSFTIDRDGKVYIHVRKYEEISISDEKRRGEFGRGGMKKQNSWSMSPAR